MSFPLKNPLKSVYSYSSSLPRQISWGGVDKSEAQDAVSDDEQCKQMYIAYAAAGGIAKMFADSEERAKRDAA